MNLQGRTSPGPTFEMRISQVNLQGRTLRGQLSIPIPARILKKPTREASLEGARLKRTQLNRANLEGAHLDGANPAGRISMEDPRGEPLGHEPSWGRSLRSEPPSGSRSEAQARTFDHGSPKRLLRRSNLKGRRSLQRCSRERSSKERKWTRSRKRPGLHRSWPVGRNL